MISTAADITDLVNELLSVLDEEIALLDLRRSQLEAVSRAVIDRDDDALERLIGQIEQAWHSQVRGDLKLKALCRALAESLGQSQQKVKLVELSDKLPKAQRLDVDLRRGRIVLQAQRFRKQHLETVVLLSECARINRLLLEGLLPGSETVTTYEKGGAAMWRSGTHLVDAES